MYCQVDAMMTETNSVVSVKYYSCCSEPYPDLTFTVSLRRVAAFYIQLHCVPKTSTF